MCAKAGCHDQIMTSGNNRTRSAKHVIQPGSIVQRPAGGLIAAFAIAAGLLMSAIGAKSQEYPAKPVRLIVNTAAGGLMDVAARITGEQLEDSRTAIRHREPVGAPHRGWRLFHQVRRA